MVKPAKNWCITCSTYVMIKRNWWALKKAVKARQKFRNLERLFLFKYPEISLKYCAQFQDLKTLHHASEWQVRLFISTRVPSYQWLKKLSPRRGRFQFFLRNSLLHFSQACHVKNACLLLDLLLNTLLHRKEVSSSSFTSSHNQSRDNGRKRNQ